MSHAVSDYRKFLVGEIHDARNTENNEVLAELRAEYDILAPYIALFKKVPRFYSNETWKSVPFRIRSTTRFCLSVNGSL